ncbi:MAG: hypothetical protein ACK55D_06610 [Synechococcaceae cyanobacterium]
MADDVFSPHAAPTASPIVTPAGSTIEAEGQGGYRVCDAAHHCTHVATLWQAQQLVQWAEVHHRSPAEFAGG